MEKQPNQNPFTILGTPSKVVINGIQEPDGDIAECLDTLQKHQKEILAYTITRINGVVKLYVAAV